MSRKENSFIFCAPTALHADDVPLLSAERYASRCARPPLRYGDVPWYLFMVIAVGKGPVLPLTGLIIPIIWSFHCLFLFIMNWKSKLDSRRNYARYSFRKTHNVNARTCPSSTCRRCNLVLHKVMSPYFVSIGLHICRQSLASHIPLPYIFLHSDSYRSWTAFTCSSPHRNWAGSYTVSARCAMRPVNGHPSNHY